MFGVFKGTALSEGDSQFRSGNSAASVERIFDRLADLTLSVLKTEVAIIQIHGADELLAIAFSDADAPDYDAVIDAGRALDDGYVSQARVPVKLGELRVGELSVMSRAERAFSPRDLELLRRFAGIAAEIWAVRLASASFEG